MYGSADDTAEAERSDNKLKLPFGLRLTPVQFKVCLGERCRVEAGAL
jgi:hypothetical protein